MRRAIGIALHRDGRHGDDRRCREAFFQRVELRFASGERKPPAVIVDRDRDMVRIFERLGRAIIGRVVEIPFRRGELPDQLGEIIGIGRIALCAALGREVKLIPPGQFGPG